MLGWIIGAVLALAIIASMLAGIYGAVSEFIANLRTLRRQLASVDDQVQSAQNELEKVRRLIREEFAAIETHASAGFLWRRDMPHKYAAALKRRQDFNVRYRELWLEQFPGEEYPNEFDIEPHELPVPPDVIIGAEYESLVARHFEERRDCEVERHGAEWGFADLGRDLIAYERNSERVYVVQCKRWSRDRPIRENVVCQLYGTAAAYQAQNPCREVVPVLASTYSPSDTAVEMATLLGIELMSVPDPRAR